MRKVTLMIMTALAIGSSTNSIQAAYPLSSFHRAHADRGGYWHNANHSWHGSQQHVQYGRPLALIVPPTANLQTNYAWGVARTTMTPIHFQFGRPVAHRHPGNTVPTPRWPSSTRDMGVYYSRGPW